MSKEKSCKCCKQIWYLDMLDKKWRLCPNCYRYCKLLIDDLKIKDKQSQKQLAISELEKLKENAWQSATDISQLLDYTELDKIIDSQIKSLKGEE